MSMLTGVSNYLASFVWKLWTFRNCAFGVERIGGNGWPFEIVILGIRVGSCWICPCNGGKGGLGWAWNSTCSAYIDE